MVANTASSAKMYIILVIPSAGQCYVNDDTDH